MQYPYKGTTYWERPKSTKSYHVNAAVETMVDFVVFDDGVATSLHRNSFQCIAMDVVVLYQTAAFSKYVYALTSVVDLVFPA